MKRRFFVIFVLSCLLYSLSACAEKSSDAAGNDVSQSIAVDSSSDNSNTTSNVPTQRLSDFERLFDAVPFCVQDENELWGYIDASGEYVIKPIFPEARAFWPNGLAAVRDAQTDLLGIIDIHGNYVVEPTLKNVYSYYTEGLLPVADVNDGWGYLDESGHYIIKPQFSYATRFSEGFARVMGKDLRWTYIDTSGKRITDVFFEEGCDFKNGLALINVGYAYGYLDTSGVIAIGAYFSDATSFCDGLAFVRMMPAGPYDERTALIDIDGNTLDLLRK